MSIGMHIKQLRKMEKLTQQEFADRLGIKRSYISMLEKAKYQPSEQLILSICREFGIRIDWLKTGQGSMYEKKDFLPKGFTLIEVIYDRLTSPERIVPLSVVAQVLGLDPEDTSHSLEQHKDLPGALKLLLDIFQENNRKKIDAVVSQLKALAPAVEQGEQVPLEKKLKKKA